METITSRDMRVLDLNCEYFGLSRLQLMENAGRSVAEEIKKRFEGGKVAIFAGTGNNGGDGFVCARHLEGFDVEVYLVSREIRSEIARRNLEILERAGYKIREVGETDAEIIVDALLGTGLKGRPRADYARAIEIINSTKAFKVAVDVPSGLDSDTGSYEVAVKPDFGLKLAFTADEEVGGKNGLKIVFEKEKADAVIIGEPTGCNSINVLQAYVLAVDLKFYGKDGHTASKDARESAIFKSASFILEMVDKFKSIRGNFEHYRQIFAELGMDFVIKTWEAAFNPSIIKGATRGSTLM